MDRFESRSAFVAVVEAGGFSAAARRLAMPLATVSRKVSELEDLLRVQLLTRTTRKVALTDIGRYHFETCRRLLEELDEAERLATGEYGAPRGDLIVTAPLLFGRLYLAPIVTEFLAAYAEVDVQLRLADRIVNLGEEGVDIALRVGHLPDSNLKAVKLGVIRQVVCASPDYLARNGIPERLADLSLHNSITCTSLEALREWTFRTRREMSRCDRGCRSARRRRRRMRPWRGWGSPDCFAIRSPLRSRTDVCGCCCATTNPSRCPSIWFIRPNDAWPAS